MQWDLGLVTDTPANRLALGRTPDAVNVLTDERPGAFLPRTGFDAVYSTNGLSKISFLFSFNKESGEKWMILSDSSRVIATTDFNTAVMIKERLTTTVNLQAMQVRNKVWFTNGVDAVFTWEGSTTQVLDGTSYGGTILANVPKGKYIEYYHDRVWIYNVSDNNSALRFSAIASTDGVALAPDDRRAWPQTNQLNIGQGDGTVGTGILSFANQLYAFKEDSTYTIFGKDEDTYFARKTVGEVGTVSNDSCDLLDNHAYLLGRLGVYVFNGNQMARISDDIDPDVETFQKDTTRIIANTWDTQDEFVRGGFQRGTTVTASGFIQLYREPQVVNSILTATTPVNQPYFTLSVNGTTSTHFGTMIPTFTVPSNFQGHPGDMSQAAGTQQRLFIRITPNGIAGAAVRATIRHAGTGQEVSGTPVGDQGGSGDEFFSTPYLIPFSTPAFTGAEINNGSFTVKIEISSGNCSSNCSIDVYAATTTAFATLSLFPETTGHYVSEITTISMLTSWGAFDAIDTPDGSTISYNIRTATSLVQIATQPFIAINPGSVIGSSVNNTFIQWNSSIATVSTTSLANIDFVSIEHVEGQGADARAIGIEWQNRYWLAVTTYAGATTSVIYVKSKGTNKNPNAWNKFHQINVKSMAKYNGNLYGGSSNSGTLYRLDYGNNDDGAAINWHLTTPDIYFEEPFFEKSLKEINVEYTRTGGGTLYVDYSVDGGTYTALSVPLSGTGRAVRSLYGVSKSGKWASIRMRGGDLDKRPEVHSLGIFYDLKQTR